MAGARPRESSDSLPNCRRCGKAMEAGFIEAETFIGRPASIRWFDAGDPVGKKLAPAPTFVWGMPPVFAAFRCRDCQLLEVGYGPPEDRTRRPP